MTADSTKSVSKHTSESQAAVNSTTMAISPQASEVNHWEIQSELSVKCIELLLGTEKLDPAEIRGSVSCLCDAVSRDRRNSISFSHLLKLRVFEAFAQAVVLSNCYGRSQWRTHLENIIRSFPPRELILYYTTTVFTMERRIWLCKVLPAVWNVLNDGGSTVDTIIKAL
ncbi:hypothetical protein GQ42DRAFT_163115, partial [Ramicandelaber brevisporus]